MHTRPFALFLAATVATGCATFAANAADLGLVGQDQTYGYSIERGERFSERQVRWRRGGGYRAYIPPAYVGRAPIVEHRTVIESPALVERRIVIARPPVIERRVVERHIVVEEPLVVERPVVERRTVVIQRPPWEVPFAPPVARFTDDDPY